MSWKRISSRDANLNLDQAPYRKSIFWIKFSKCLHHLKWILNVDESLFSRDTKILYSQFRKGSKQPIKNIFIKSSVTIMSAISSFGKTYNVLKTDSYKGSDFIQFMKDVIQDLNEIGYESNKIGVILDNWSIHRSKLSMEFLKNQGISIYFIPPYWPELAPIEKYFSILKVILCKKWSSSSIRINKKEGFKLIIEWIKSIPAETIISLWRHLMENIESIMKNTKELI